MGRKQKKNHYLLETRDAGFIYIYPVNPSEERLNLANKQTCTEQTCSACMYGRHSKNKHIDSFPKVDTLYLPHSIGGIIRGYWVFRVTKAMRIDSVFTYNIYLPKERITVVLPWALGWKMSSPGQGFRQSIVNKIPASPHLPAQTLRWGPRWTGLEPISLGQVCPNFF